MSPTFLAACYCGGYAMSTRLIPYLPARKVLFLARRASLQGGPMRVAIIADDLTGAADTGVQLARAGYRTAVAFLGASIEAAHEPDAVAADTDSRAADAATARARVRAATERLAGATIVMKKVDSTLRGPVAAEIAAALEA